MLNERVEPFMGFFDLAKAGADAVANVRLQRVSLRLGIIVDVRLQTHAPVKLGVGALDAVMEVRRSPSRSLK